MSSKAASKKAVKVEFEKSLADLEALVNAMEKGNLSLEDSLKAFEEGVKLSRDCQQALKDAEQKVEILLGKDGQTQPFNTEAS